jgi:pimeloyl-ACP methyl ester carboxylesterase
MRIALPLLLLAATAAADRTDEVAAHYRRLVDANAGLAEGVVAAERHLLGSGTDRAFLAARAAWRFLAAGNAEKTDRERALLIYNLACCACASQADWSKGAWSVAGTSVRLERGGFLAESFRELAPAFLQDTKRFGKRVVTRGVGGAVYVVMPKTEQRASEWPYLPPVDFAYAASAVLRFDGDAPRLVLHDPLERESVELFGKTRTLEADFTAPIAAIATQVDNDELAERGVRTPSLDLEALYVLEPPRDTKTPVLFVHGLESSAAAFRELAAALRADPAIRSRFQFVAYQYPTGYPLALLNIRLRRVMREFWTWFDARAPKARGRGYVAVGHSMGGLQVKALAVSSGRRVWDMMFAQPPSEVDLSGREGEVLKRMALFEPDPKLARIVFLAVPHRGSGLATGIVGALGRGRVREDPIVTDLRETVLVAEPRSGIDALNPESRYLRTLAELPFREGLPYHSIIGDLVGNLQAPKGDGVVPYESAHLDGAASELVVHAAHSVQRNPRAIAEVKRILLLHLEQAKR